MVVEEKPVTGCGKFYAKCRKLRLRPCLATRHASFVPDPNRCLAAHGTKRLYLAHSGHCDPNAVNFGARVGYQIPWLEG